jgi:nucleotide-binding universal stress UspA family protein
MALDPISPTAIGRAITPIMIWTRETNEEELASARIDAEAATEDLCDAGLDAEPVVAPGDPRHVLINEARRCAAACVFVGSTGKSRVERLLLGSVSSWLPAHAPCSVEIVRTGLSEPEDYY